MTFDSFCSYSKCILTLFHSFSYLPAARNLPCGAVRPRNKKNKLTHTCNLANMRFLCPPTSSLSLSLYVFSFAKANIFFGDFSHGFSFSAAYNTLSLLGKLKKRRQLRIRETKKQHQQKLDFFSPTQLSNLHNALRKQLMEIIVPRGGKNSEAISGKRIAAGDVKIDVNNVVPSKGISGLSF